MAETPARRGGWRVRKAVSKGGSSPSPPGTPLPDEFLSFLLKRTAHALRRQGIVTCEAFLTLTEDLIVKAKAIPGAGLATWEDIAAVQPYVWRYLDGEELGQVVAAARQSQSREDERKFQELSGLGAGSRTPLPDAFSPFLLKRTERALRRRGIVTCEAFLALTERTIVSVIPEAGLATWANIAVVQPYVRRYLNGEELDRVVAAAWEDDSRADGKAVHELFRLIAQPGTPLPHHLLVSLSAQAADVLRENKIETCEAFCALGKNTVKSLRKAGVTTWLEIANCQPRVRAYLTSAHAPQEREVFFRCDFRLFTSFDAFLADFFHRTGHDDATEKVLRYRLGLYGDGAVETQAVVAERCSSPVYRGWIGNLETDIRRRWFDEAGRRRVVEFLDAASQILDEMGGAEVFVYLVRKLEALAGWQLTENPLRVIRFLQCFDAVDYHAGWGWGLVTAKKFGREGKTAKLLDFFRSFCQNKRRPFSALSYENFSRFCPGVSFAAYCACGYKLLKQHVLPQDKQLQLESFVLDEKETFAAAGDARPTPVRVLSVLERAHGPLSFDEWLVRCQEAFPGEDIGSVQIRYAMAHPETVNYDRGRYIWHEYVSIPPELARTMEEEIARHLRRHDLEACSLYGFYQEWQERCWEVHIPTQTLLYFLLKRQNSGLLAYPEYPYLTLPGTAYRIGAMIRIAKEKLFRGRKSVPYAEMRRFYVDVLRAPPIRDFKRGDVLRQGERCFLAERKKEDK